MRGNTREREYPHNIPITHRRFKNGAWQRPTQKGRGWEPSQGLSGMTYEQGRDFLKRNAFVDVTSALEIPVANVAADLPTNPMHRRFNTALGIWEKPNRTLTGWKPSGIANYPLEKGNEFFAYLKTRMHGYINIGPTSPEVVEAENPVEAITTMSRRFNTALGIWEKPNRDLTGWVPSRGIAGKTYEQGLEFLAANFPANYFAVSVVGEIVEAEKSPVEVVAVEALDELVGNPAAGYGPFGTPFVPVVTVLANGGLTLTVDALGAMVVTRALLFSLTGLPAGKADAERSAPLVEAIRNAESPFEGERLYDAAVGTIAMGA